MREIKFRGKTPKGTLIFGDLSYSGGNVFVGEYRVMPETVSQLCGYDSNDDEVYEGDEVVAHDKSYKVELVPKYGLFNNLKFCVKK